jgi:hypothetical protein
MIKNAAAKIFAPAGDLGFEASVVLSVNSFTLEGFVGTGAICGVMVFLLCCCLAGSSRRCCIPNGGEVLFGEAIAGILLRLESKVD